METLNRKKMHKKETTQLHNKIANDMMNYINNHIDTDINIDDLALEFKISKFHFHRIFKEQMGENIYQTIKSIRLQKASNLLITNKHSTITKIASMCGYSSQTSFLRAFKERFEQTPKVWRNGGYKEYSNKILNTCQTVSLIAEDYACYEPTIVKTPRKIAYYIREKGYGNKATQIWKKMKAWLYTNNITEFEQIGIYHDNPIITKHDDCYYVAAIVPLCEVNLDDTNLPSFEIYEGLCACFNFEGEYEDILKLIQWVYHYWLPNSGYEATTIPSYTIFEKNYFLDDGGSFKATYYVPIQYT